MDEKIKDFGKKIGGAKKDNWKHRGFSHGDLSNLNAREYNKYVRKKNIWIKPNYEEEVEKDGKEPVAALFAKKVRNKLPAQVKSKSKEDFEDYITIIELYRDVMKDIKTVNDILNAINIVREEAMSKNFWDNLRRNPYVKTLKLVNIDIIDFRKLLSETKIQNFPYNFSGIAKGMYAINYNMVNNGKGGYAIANGKKRIRKPDGTYFKTEDEAIEYAKNTYVPMLEKEKEEKRKKRKKNKKGRPVRPQLKNVERIGPETKNDKKDIDGKDLLKDFNLRGGEFGNWNNQLDRQAYLNHAYEAFFDLARVLGSSNEFIGIEGYKGKRLAIAFGSRGSGNAAAHYEPSRVVINLTKLRGSGSLAHEFGHVFDDFLALKCAKDNREYNSLNQKNSTVLLSAIRNYKPNPYNTFEHQEIVDAFANVLNAIYTRNMTIQEMIDFQKSEAQRFINRIKRQTQSVGTRIQNTTTEQTKAVLDAKDEFLNDICMEKFNRMLEIHENIFNEPVHSSVKENVPQSIKWYLGKVEKAKQLEQGVVPERPLTKKTDYYNNSFDIDGGKVQYFATAHELFARAFESYIQDVIESSGNKSEYLVHGTHNEEYGSANPYPEGIERTTINQAMAELIKLIVDTFDKPVVKEDEIDLKEESKFKLTLFKNLCKERKLSVDMGKTPVLKQDGKEWYKIEFPKEEYVEHLIIPKYNDILGKGHEAKIVLKNKTKPYYWDETLDYTDLVMRIEISAIKSQTAERLQKEREEKEKKRKEQQKKRKKDKLSGLVDRKKVAEELRLKAKERGLRLLTDETTGTIILHHGTSKENIESIKKNGFNPNTTFSHAKTKTGYGYKGPKEYGHVLSVKVDPRAVKFNEKEDGDFIAPKGLISKNKIWTVGNGNVASVKKPTNQKPIKQNSKKETLPNKTKIKYPKNIENIKTPKDIRDVLNDFVQENPQLRIKTPHFFNPIYEKVNHNIKFLQEPLNNMVIGLRPLDKELRQGNSKVWHLDRSFNLYIKGNADNKKKLEGLVEGTTNAIVTVFGFERDLGLANERQHIKEAITYMICKNLGLDVRTYIRGRKAKILLIKGPEELKKVIKNSIDIYIKLLRLYN